MLQQPAYEREGNSKKLYEQNKSKTSVARIKLVLEKKKEKREENINYI